MENRLEKMNFADLVKDSKSIAGFSPCRQFRVGPNDVTYIRPGWEDSFKMAASEVDLSKRVLQDSGHFRV